MRKLKKIKKPENALKWINNALDNKSVVMGFDTDFFTPIFVISRITGWSAHIIEQYASNKLIRPLASYKGNKHRKVIQIKKR